MYIATITKKFKNYNTKKSNFGKFENLTDLKKAINEYKPSNNIAKYRISYIIEGKTKTPRCLINKAV